MQWLQSYFHIPWPVLVLTVNEKVAQLFFVLDLTKDKPKDGSCAYAAWSGMCILKADQISDFISCEGVPWAATIVLHGK